MLQALLDESESKHGPRVFALAGYISTIERWEGFTKAWDKVLGETPRLDYFSFREAFPASGKPSGQFNNLTPSERDEKVAVLRSVIEEWALAEVSLAFSVDYYERAFAGMPTMDKNPYYFAAMQLDMAIVANLEKMGLEQGPIDFIYDNKNREEPRVLDAWFYAREKAKPNTPGLFEKILINAPMFRSSRDVIALQAADMIAGYVRWSNVAVINGLPKPSLPGVSKHMPGLFMTYTDEMLRAAAQRIRQRNEANP